MLPVSNTFGLPGVPPEVLGLVPGGLGVCGCIKAGLVSDFVTRFGVDVLAFVLGLLPRLADDKIQCFQ